MEPLTTVSGFITMHAAKVLSFMLLAMFTREIGEMTEQMEKASTFQRMVVYTLENGAMTCNTVKGLKFGKMGLSLKEFITKDSRKGLVNTNGRMDHFTKGTGRIMLFVELEFKNGRTEELTKENSKIT